MDAQARRSGEIAPQVQRVRLHPGRADLHPGGVQLNRQKLFFFWGQEWQRDRTVEEQTFNVPTAAMRNGDFSALLPGRVIRDPLHRPAVSRATSSHGTASAHRAWRCSTPIPLPTPGFQQGANN